MEFSLNDLLLIKNKDKRIRIQNEIILNYIISQTIHHNTSLSKANKIKLSQIEHLLKANSLYDNLVTDTNRHILNKMPYMLLGLVETTFVDEVNNRRVNEYGCGIVVSSNVVLIPGKNLIYEEVEEQEGTDDNNNQHPNKNNYTLFEIEFKPLNVSPEYRAYLPKAIKVDMNFTPLNDSEMQLHFDTEHEEEEGDMKNNEEGHNTNTHNGSVHKRIKEGIDEDNNNNNEDGDRNEDANRMETFDKLFNNWGLALLDYPVGDVLNFIYYDSQKKEKGVHMKTKKPKSDIDLYSNSIMNLIQIKPLTIDEISNCKFSFLEIFSNDLSSFTTNENQSNVDNNESDYDMEEPKYIFHESCYETYFDSSKFIYLKNSIQNPILENLILPGFIIGEHLGKFHLVGMFTNSIIKNAAETSNANENEDNTIMNNNDNTTCHVAIRFNRAICELINTKIQELEEHNVNEVDFNATLFTLINNNIKSKHHLLNLFKNNCELLYSLINSLKSAKNLTSYDISSFHLHNDTTLKFIQFALMLIYNKYTSNPIESKIIDFENARIGFFPGSSILGEIIRSRESLSTLSLKGNDLFDEGVKEIMLPIFNKKKILDTGKELKCLCLDSNKLTGKSLKYIRHLIKVSPQLSLISLSNNNIKGSSLRHLVNVSKEKHQMKVLHLHNNILGSACGEHMHSILLNLSTLQDLNISCNCIGDAAIPRILDALKHTACIDILNLSHNDITHQSSAAIANFLSNNKYLRILWLNNNPLATEGLTKISQALSTKLVLQEINVSSIAAGDDGGRELFENLKMNTALRRLYANGNEFAGQAMKKFGEMMRKDNENQASEGGVEFVSMSMNRIDDEGVFGFVEELVEYRWIKELKLNSNVIGNEGAKNLLFAVLKNPAIMKLNIENNNITLSINDESFDYKAFRGDIQIDL